MATPLDDKLKRYLLKNIPALKGVTDCNDDLLDKMIGEGILTKVKKQEIVRGTTEPDDDIRTSRFYSKLMQISVEDYKNAVRVLQECGQKQAAQLLLDGLGVVGENKCDDEIDFESTTKLNVIVKPSMQFMDDPKTDYKMRSSPRGEALIISNIRFPHARSEYQRRGGEKDHGYILALLEGLGYSCDIRLNLKQIELESVLNKFKAKLAESNYVDSMVVAVMSHGTQNWIEMVDGGRVHLWKDIVYKFKDVLPKKPKIFIIEACQEFETPGAHHHIPEEPIPETGNPMRDTLICLPTQPGTSAFRDAYLGTRFIYCLSKVFMENAHDTHLIALMKKVQITMLSMKGEHKDKQVGHCYDYLEKKVFFNPPPI